MDYSAVVNILSAALTAAAATLTVLLGVHQLTSGMRLRGAQASLASALDHAHQPNQRRLLRGLHGEVSGGIVARLLVPWTGFVIPVVTMVGLIAATATLGAFHGKRPVPGLWTGGPVPTAVLGMGFFLALFIAEMTRLAMARAELANAFSRGLDLSTVQKPSLSRFVIWWCIASGICIAVFSYTVAFQIALPYDDPFRDDPYASWSEYRSASASVAMMISAISGMALFILSMPLWPRPFKKRTVSFIRDQDPLSRRERSRSSYSGGRSARRARMGPSRQGSQTAPFARRGI